MRGPGDTRSGYISHAAGYGAPHTPPLERYHLPRRHSLRELCSHNWTLVCVIDISASTATSDPPGHRWYALSDLCAQLPDRRGKVTVAVVTFDDCARLAVPPSCPDEASEHLLKLAGEPLGGGTAFGPPARLLLELTSRSKVPTVAVWATDLGAPLPDTSLTAAATAVPSGLVALNSWANLPDDNEALATAAAVRGWPQMTAVGLSSLDRPPVIGAAIADLAAAQLLT